MLTSHLWVATTLAAAAGQVARNAMQRGLTETIGVSGATAVRFLFGLPFALLFLPAVLAATGEPLPRPNGSFAPFLAGGSLAQVVATGLMLAAMRLRSFSVVTALVKTEPMQVVVFGLLVLGETVTPPVGLAVGVATAGIALMSWPRSGGVPPGHGGPTGQANWRPVLLGVASGGVFALSAVCFRGALLSLETGSFLVRATTTLALSLVLQTALVGAALVCLDRPALRGTLRVWRASLAAGFVGALTSQFWLIGFALTATANVRTLGLVEVVMAQAVTGRILRQRQGRAEIVGIGLVLAGVGGLLVATR